MPNPLASNLSTAERLARLRLINTERVGPVTYHQLMGRYGSAEAALEVIPALASQGGSRRAPKIGSMADAKREMGKADQAGVSLLFAGDAPYPKRLAAIQDAPPVLYVRGTPHLLPQDSIGVVGTRNASANGLLLAGRLSDALSKAGIVIVSGLARGIDSRAHEASLAGGTVACMAGGVDHIYPRENAALYEAITAQGALVSEMPMGTVPQARHFPRRNRLISGLSLGVLVVEAATRSGSLITARVAGEQGREVFAVPGSPLDARAEGGNKLIREGAILVERVEDILDELESLRRRPLGEPDALPLFQYAQNHKNKADTGVDQDVTNQVETLLSASPTAIDDLIRLSGAPAGAVMAALLALELAGKVARLDGARVTLSSGTD